jgi:Lon protease-like protein
VLQGTARFQVLEELSMHRGYRRVRARLLTEPQEGEESGQELMNKILSVALDYCHRHDIRIDADVLATLPGWRLVNSLSAALPFQPEEKQALLESRTVWSRGDVLLQLLEMSGAEADGSFVPMAPN